MLPLIGPSTCLGKLTAYEYIVNLYARKKHFPKAKFLGFILDPIPLSYDHSISRDRGLQDLTYNKCPCVKIPGMAGAAEIVVDKVFEQYLLSPYI